MLNPQKFYGKHLVFRLIRQTTFMNANRIEKQIATAYHLRGEAHISKRFRNCAGSPPRNGVEIYVEGYGVCFYGYNSVAHTFSVSAAQVKSAIKDGGVLRMGFGKSALVSFNPIGIDFQI